MPINRCLHKFEALAEAVLPKYMERLRKSISQSVRAHQFVAPGGLPRDLATQIKKGARDFPGCYVFLRGTRPVYVGISRKVRSRVRQHIRGRSHYEATLAYRMAKGTRRVGARAKNMKSPAFVRRFTLAKQRLSTHRVACVVIRNPLELYIFEAYAAMALDTARWNTFETH
jgi:hypothetical protein